MKLEYFEMFTNKSFRYVKNADSGEKVSILAKKTRDCNRDISNTILWRAKIIESGDPSNTFQEDNKLLQLDMKNHKDFQERLKKTLYYGTYMDGSLPSPIATG